MATLVDESTYLSYFIYSLTAAPPQKKSPRTRKREEKE